MRRALILALSYLSWNAAFQLVILSIVLYLMQRSGSTFREISDTTTTNQVLIVGIASLGFIFVLTQLNPIATVNRTEIITGNLIETQFYPAFLRGAVYACIFTIVSLAFGFYHYVGFFVQSDAPALALFGLLFRVLSIISMVYIDEFVFRSRFLAHLRDSEHPLRTIALSALFYALSKALPFHLGLAHLLTLALIGTALSLRSVLNRTFADGAGILAGFLVIAHCAFSLPIFGNESQGIVLLQYDLRLDLDAPYVRFLTGGLGGPLSSVVLQAFILFDIVQTVVKKKKSLWPLRSAAVR